MSAPEATFSTSTCSPDADGKGKVVGQTRENFDEDLLNLNVHFTSENLSSVSSEASALSNIAGDRSQPPAPNLHHVVIEDSVFEKWRQLGARQGMSTDTQIANFLLQQYENILNGIHPAAQCISCHAHLPLCCSKCIIPPQVSNSAELNSLQRNDLEVGIMVSRQFTSFVNDGSSGLFQNPSALNDHGNSLVGDASELNLNNKDTLEGFQLDADKIFKLSRKKKKKGKKIKLKRGEYTCQECGTHITPAPNQKSKQRVRYKPYKCAGCGASFTYRRALEEHLFKKMETNDSFQCTHCNTVLLNPSDLRLHSVKHTEEMPYKCPECPLAFSLACNLKTHMRTHTGERPFKCVMCERAFTQSIALKVHMRKHTGEKPFRCDLCDMAFAASSNLSRHMLRHTGQKPYKCQYCQAAFSQPGSLKTHTRKHTGERPYRCENCGAAFSDHSTLWKHKRNNTCTSGTTQMRNRKVIHSLSQPTVPTSPLPQSSSPLPHPHISVTLPELNQQTAYRTQQLEEVQYAGNVGWCLPMQHQ